MNLANILNNHISYAVLKILAFTILFQSCFIALTGLLSFTNPKDIDIVNELYNFIFLLFFITIIIGADVYEDCMIKFKGQP